MNHTDYTNLSFTYDINEMSSTQHNTTTTIIITIIII